MPDSSDPSFDFVVGDTVVWSNGQRALGRCVGTIIKLEAFANRRRQLRVLWNDGEIELISLPNAHLELHSGPLKLPRLAFGSLNSPAPGILAIEVSSVVESVTLLGNDMTTVALGM